MARPHKAPYIPEGAAAPSTQEILDRATHRLKCLVAVMPPSVLTAKVDVGYYTNLADQVYAWTLAQDTPPKAPEPDQQE